MTRLLLLLMLATGPALTAPAQTGPPGPPVKIALAGDSTARDYAGMSESYRALHGWGMYLDDYLAEGSVKVLNHGKGGCSSKSFLAEGRWDTLLADGPDLVLIQFGHNAIPGKGPHRETRPEDVPATLPADGHGSAPTDWARNNFRTCIETARAAGVTPVIVTPMERRAFASDGQQVRAKNKPWADAAAAVAAELDVAVIDMNAFSAALLNDLGFEGCLFMHPTRDDQLDNTHYNEAGARIYAEFIARTLADLRPEVHAADARKTTGYVPVGVPR